jgi:hypothetical protein
MARGELRVVEWGSEGKAGVEQRAEPRRVVEQWRVTARWPWVQPGCPVQGTLRTALTVVAEALFVEVAVVAAAAVVAAGLSALVAVGAGTRAAGA